MLLQLDNAELLVILSDNKILMSKINEALAVLKDYQRKRSQQNVNASASPPNDGNMDISRDGKITNEPKSFQVYNKNGVLIRFYFVSSCRILTVIENTNHYEVKDFEIMLDLDLSKCIKLPTLEPRKKYQFELNAVDSDKPLIVKMEIKYMLNGRELREKEEIRLPSNCC